MKSHWLAAILAGTVGFSLTGRVSGQSPSPVDAPVYGPTTGVFEQPAFGSAERFWFSSEYLLWWISAGPAPIPVASAAPATSPTRTAALGNPDTTILLGGSPLGHGPHSGGRFTIGSWLDANQSLGIEANYFFLAQRSTEQTVAADESLTAPILGNPFFDVASGVESLNYLSVLTAGSTTLTGRARMQGTELNFVGTLRATPNTRVVLLTGFRFLQLHEGITVTTTQTDPIAIFFPGQFVNTVDDFATRNNFYAGQLGARVDAARGRWFLQGTAKVALGSMREVVEIQGYTTTNTGPNFAVPIPVTTVPGGIYAQPTNIGQQSRDRFAVAPEVTIQVGAQITQRLRAFVGYNFLYVSEVVRPGNQMDRSINSTYFTSFTGVPTGPLVGAPRPGPLFAGSDFWAQGIDFGVSLTW